MFLTYNEDIFMHNSQEIATTIKQLTKTQNISVGKLLLDCELSKNTLSSMQAGGYLPRLETIARIAEYLNCSVEIGRAHV